MLQVTVFYRGPRAKNGKNAAGRGTNGVRLVGNAARRMARRAATAAPAAGSNIPEGLSSPAALALPLRYERPSANGLEGGGRF